MPKCTGSVQGLPAVIGVDRRDGDDDDRAHDGAAPVTNAVCRHLVGDAFLVPGEPRRREQTERAGR